MADRLRGPLQDSSAPRDKEPKELEKLRKWQEERAARKLKGEYQSAILHLSDVIYGNLKTPLRISAVRVEGAKHTRLSFLGSIINPAIATASPDHSSTLEDVIRTTRRIYNSLGNTGIFSSIEAYVDRARDPLAGLDAVDVIFRMKEKGRYYFASSTELGNNEATATASGRISNVFGGAETFEANTSLGLKTRRSFRGTFTMPLTSDMNTVAELSSYAVERDLTTYASCFEGLRGSRAAIRHGSLHSGLHEIAYEAVIRHIASLTKTASITMREAAGTSIKSSLSHSFTYDTRDDRIAASRGVYGRVYQELAGLKLGGDADFYKIEAEGQVSRKLGNTGLSISLAAKTGLLWGLGDEHPKTLFSDRFQLGGPTSVRSFKMNGMGPRDGEDSTGGQMYYSGGISLVSDIPSKANWPIKMHAWLNAGRLDGVDQGLPLKETIISSLSRPSMSAGLGLIYRLDPVRIEMNFGMPLVISKSEGAKKGIQVGIGLQFM